ncbi:MAG: DUF393 domain-containing protein [Solirubrobacteraceae bacterium]|nr:DUF393 domain-containing protein [Solirubrobacteraceae bacterium]
MSAPRGLLWVFYDGECGLCAGSMAWALRRDRAGRLKPVPYQDPEAARRLGPAAASARDELHVWSEEGGLRAGVEAVSALLARLPGWSAAGALLARPPVLWVARPIYRAVARRRRSLGGAACPLPAARSR